MGNNNLYKVENTLRSIAKRYKSVKYSLGLAILFLMMGVGAFSEEVNPVANGVPTREEIATSRENLRNSVGSLQSKIDEARAENSKSLAGLRLELIQLMEQGDQVVKSPWMSWQFGVNYMYSKWNGTYKGRGDKAEKYPFEGIFTRSNDLFLRNISPDSDVYEKYTSSISETSANSATTSTIKKRGGSLGYGIASTLPTQEPIVQIELGASVRPKKITKSPITVTPPSITVNAVTPLSTPTDPSAPTPPKIDIQKFDPVAPDPITVSLPTPPTFNIKLGSYRNYMTQDTLGDINGGRHTGAGKSINTSGNTSIGDSELGSPTIIYAWQNGGGVGNFDSALLKAYFDYTRMSGPGGGTLTVTGNITIDSVNTLNDAEKAAEGDLANKTGRYWNAQPFLVGGSRVATLDNANGGATILNKATVNMVGPLVVGYEIQNDGGGAYAGTKKREVINAKGGKLTDDAEKDMLKIGGLEKGKIGGGYDVKSDSIELIRPENLGNDKITVTRTRDIVDSKGNVLVKGGYTGYKIGMILTHEYDDPNPGINYYRLINDGEISFMGRNSIGIQVYAPPANNPNTVIHVINGESGDGAKTITLGGIQSYGLKLSSRILKDKAGQKSVFENRGTINISGGDGNEESLSSGIAVLEDAGMTGNKAIRAHKDLVINKGKINVSGGQGNSGMVLKVKANDDITNNDDGTITVTGNKNIGMRVDLGTTKTDDSGTFTPKAINKGKITINNGLRNIGMVANNSDGNHKAIAENNSGASITFKNNSTKAIGMFSQDGGEIVNVGDIKGEGNSLKETIGMAIQPALSGSGHNNTASNGINKGDIDLSGEKVTGVYNQGKFINEKNITTSGGGSISLYAKGQSSKTEIKSGTITAKNKALGLFADGKATIELGGAGDNALSLKADGLGTLLFYNYTKSGSTYTADGKFKLVNNVDGELTNGATAFYFRDTTPGKTAGTTADKLNAMFGGSTSGKILKLKLDENSTLFVLDNTSPNTTPVKLSSVALDKINEYLGQYVKVSPNSSKNFKAYKATKATLSIDDNVDLDNHTGVQIDKYYRVDFINSSVTVAAGKKMYGTDVGKLKQAIAQANFDGGNVGDVKVTNNGTIDYSKKAATAVVVDFGQATNNGLIKMDAANGDKQNSIGLFGASSSILTNSSTGEIQLGTKGVGIWGANKIDSSLASWSKNINIVNAGKITGLAGKEGIFGIYANNSEAGAISTITHSGTIDLSQVAKSIGILMTKGTLTSSGNVSVQDGSVGISAKDSNVTINGGTHTIGKKSAGLKLTGNTSRLMANSGNISITGIGSAAYLFDNVNLTSGTNFKDNLALTATNGYTYINISNNSILNYKNTRTINNDESIFVNAKNSTINLLSGTTVTSTKKKITGVYSENSAISNAGTLTLTGDGSSALYGKAGSDLINSGKITIGKNGSGIYSINSTGKNNGEITIGEGSVGMRAENAIIENETTGKITSTGTSVLGMSQSGGTQNIINKGAITLTGDKSIALHSEGINSPNHKVINTGNITVGDSSNILSPSIGIYSANATNSTVENSGKVVAGTKSTAIYAGNVDLTGTSETTAGDGGIGVYSKEGTVKISENSKINVGATLGKGQEGVGVYLAGNNQTLNSDTDKLSIKKGSFGYVMTGQGNTVRTGKVGTTGIVSLSNDSVFMYSGDRTGTIRNYNNLKSTGNENYGIYALGSVENRGNIDFSQGVGNVGAYSYVEGATTTPNAIKNYGTIKVSKSDINDSDNRKYGIGMAAGYSEETPKGSGNFVTRGLGHIENHGTIKVTDPDSIGMYATGSGSKILNAGRIELSGPKRNIGIFAENGAEVINTGTITTVGSGNVGQIGIAIRKGAILDNRGTINIDASKGYGLLIAGGIVKNYGEANITVGSGATKIKEVSAADTSKEIEDLRGNKVKIHSPAGAANGVITENGVVRKPKIVHVQAIPNRKPNDIPTSSVGMYMDTSGINYTRPINNIGALRGLTQSDIIIGVEATKYTTVKTIQLGQDIIEPYNEMIRKSGIEKFNIYSGSLTWMASITQLPDYTIRNAYLRKIPYTVWAGKMATPIDKNDTYNFTDGLEQRYGVEGIGTRENQVFQKLNSIGNNEEILLYQAFDEMMGHQYANVQQRVQTTGIILDKEFKYLRDEWRTASKDSNKIKVFGTNGEYKTDTAGVIDYKNHAYGVAYVHENEDIKLGRGIGWYTGIVHNTFKFKDIGKSKEHMLQAKVGLLKSVPFDDNNSLNWTISGDIFVGRNRMHRKYLVVDEIFNAKARYYTYGIGVKNEIGKEFRLSESFTLRPYAALKLEYGRVSKIREKSGEVKLEVKQNQYFSVKPEIGAELGFKHYFGMKALKTTLGVAYENELGRVANGKNKARVVDTTADWFNIRGEKEDRRGNVKFDLNLGLDNQKYGVTANVGYDTKGENLRGGLGLRVIF
ncbi:autotransporter-associated N-terminal domain-containing protein [Fusobacterium nucleatum]|uniref:autotransporter-associated N-terminal domain-containing protein n=1 Tax=Fusobacterium nucleatum TaxID=851 RepID=UPI0030CF994C